MLATLPAGAEARKADPLKAVLATLKTPAGGYGGSYAHGRPARFKAGASVGDFTPPRHGAAPGGDPADCAHSPAFDGPRLWAFEEPYIDTNHDGHYDPGEPYVDCNGNGRWEGNLLGGGGGTRFYDHIADPVGARALVVSAGHRTIAVEVLDQEGLFNVYQEQIRRRVAADGYHLTGIFISATHDESAPDSLGLGGVSQTSSGVNNYWVQFMIKRSAQAIERAYRALRPARIRYSVVREPANLRQCWSSYPYVDDQQMPVLQAISAGRHPRTIATLVNVSQHAETLAFNGGTGALDAQNNWVSSDWIHFLRARLEKRLGGVGIEMAGSVGSVESPEVYSRAISRVPQQFVDAGHPAGCRTLFKVGAATDTTGAGHAALGYFGETRAWGNEMAGVVIGALRSGHWHYSGSNAIWGARKNICVPLDNELFALGAAVGVFAERPGYNADCTKANPVLPNGSSSGQALRSEVAGFRIGDGEFISLPGEVFPFTYMRGFQGPADMAKPGPGLPPWLLSDMHGRYRFFDGLAEDMVGYIFPLGNAVGIPTSSNPNPSGRDRFGCGHSDDAEAASPRAADIAGGALAGLLRRLDGAPERVITGRYVLPGGVLSRDPLGGPELKCTVDRRFHASRRPAHAVELSSGRVVRPRLWMSLSGLPQTRPNRDTRGYFDARGRRVWIDVYPNAR